MSFVSKLLKQKAVYWGSPTKDGYGKLTFADPVEINCRWEDTGELFLNDQAEQVVSKSVIWPNQDLEKNGYLWLGLKKTLTDAQKADPSTLSGASLIQGFEKVPNVRGSDFVRMAWF